MGILSIYIFLIGAFVLSSFKKIPVRYVGQIKILGKRIEGKFVTEGWCFLPFHPFLYDVILIDIGKVRFNVVAEKALTPDGASSRVPIDIVFVPYPPLLIEYINSGGKEGVKEQFEGKVQERVREWCFDQEGGPADWKELNKSRLEGTSILVTELAKNSITIIPEYAQEVPTWIWMRYFTIPQPKVLLENEKVWGNNNWTIVKEVLNKIRSTHGEAGIKTLEESIKKRREEILSLRTGEGEIIVKDLGIVIKRLNIGDIDVLGEVAKHADQKAKEKLERDAEEFELDHVLKQVKKFTDKGYSSSDAMEAVQTERNKVNKNINEAKINISPATIQSFEKVFGPLVESVIKKFFKPE